MKTLENIKNRGSKAFDGRDFSRLIQFIPEEELIEFDIELLPQYKDKHHTIPFNRENVLIQLKKDVEFGFEKALDKRGLSSDAMSEVVMMWNWILEDGLENFKEYPNYGLPIFKATAIKYGFDNPIGNDSGDEDKYNSD